MSERERKRERERERERHVELVYVSNFVLFYYSIPINLIPRLGGLKFSILNSSVPVEALF